MTHQPPIPAAATSPYPLHPAPIVATPDSTRAKDSADATPGGFSATVIGIGAALSAVAAIGGLVFARRRRTTTNRRDDARKRGAADRRRVATGQPYEVAYFARKHSITAAQARDIIRQAGPDRKAANALANARAKAMVP